MIKIIKHTDKLMKENQNVVVLMNTVHCSKF